MIKIRLLIVALFMAIVGCEDASTLKQDFDRSGEELRVTVIFHDTKRELNESFYERFGRDGIDRMGYAVFANPGNRPYWCEIHALRPTRGDDENMDTLGHELSHCLFGAFHPEP